MAERMMLFYAVCCHSVGMRMDKDIRKILNLARKQGYQIAEHGNKHVKVYRDNRLVVVLSGTASCPRDRSNAISQLRQAGVEIPR